MIEYVGVYIEFVDVLLEVGYGVYVYDYKGYGKIVKKEEDYGYFELNIGWN